MGTDDGTFEEGQELELGKDVPVKLIKAYTIVEGVAAGFDVLFLVLTLIDPDTQEEEGLLLPLPSEDALSLANSLKSLGATISPAWKQDQRRNS